MTRPSPTAPLLFFFQTLLSQVIASSAAIGVWDRTSSISWSLSTAAFLGLSVAAFLKMPRAWRIVNMLLPLSIAGSLTLTVPGWIFGLPLAALVMLHAPALWTRVPYYPTSRAAYPLILAELPVEQPFVFIDIGCGCGDLLVFLHKHRPLGQFHGVEIGVLPYLISKAKASLRGEGAITIRYQNFHRLDLGVFDYVYAFLSPAVMTSVWNKAYREMKPGGTFITNSFECPERSNYSITVKDARGSSLFVHKMGHREAEQRCGSQQL